MRTLETAALRKNKATDAVTWTAVTQPGTSERLNNVLYSQGQFVAVGERGAIVVSENSEVWTPCASGVTGWLHGLSYEGGLWIATGEAGAATISYDAKKWTAQVTGTKEHLESITFDAAYSYTVKADHWRTRFFLAVGSSGVVMVWSPSSRAGWVTFPPAAKAGRAQMS